MAAHDIFPGSDARKNWTHINANSAALRLLEAKARTLSLAVAELRRQLLDRPAVRFPFRIYTTPNSERTEADPDWWRKFRVQHGYVNNTKTAGCDDSDGEGTTPEVVTVPAGVTRHYFWLEAQTSNGAPTSSTLKHGTNPAAAGNWTSYPSGNWVGTKFFTLIGWVDTSTDQANKRALIRQRLREDLVMPGGTGVNWKGEYAATSAYSVGDIVKVSYGGYAGTYINTTAVSANHTDYPWLGIKWAMVGKCTEQGSWT